VRRSGFPERSRLVLIVGSRNQIVHSCDVDPLVPGSVTPLTPEDAVDAISAVEAAVRAIDAIL
jgi:hypothetical protein